MTAEVQRPSPLGVQRNKRLQGAELERVWQSGGSPQNVKLQYVYRQLDRTGTGMAAVLLVYRISGQPIPMTPKAMAGFKEGMLKSLTSRELGGKHNGTFVTFKGEKVMRFDSEFEQDAQGFRSVVMVFRHRKGTQLMCAICPAELWTATEREVEAAVDSFEVAPPPDESMEYQVGQAVGYLMMLAVLLLVIKRATGGSSQPPRRQRRRRVKRAAEEDLVGP